MSEGGEDAHSNIGVSLFKGEINFPRESVIKYDRDIATIGSLQRYAQENGRTVVLSGGLAVEAHCGGRMTRKHGDIDASLTVKKEEIKQVSTDLQSILLAEKHTKWVLHEENADSPNKIEFRENAPDTPWQDRRRLELLIRSSIPENQVQKRKLIDSMGKETEVTVDHIAELVAHKVRIFNRERKRTENEPQKRTTNINDETDLKRLIAVSDFESEECIKRLSDYYMYKEAGTITKEDADLRAQNEWKEAMLAIDLTKS